MRKHRLNRHTLKEGLLVSILVSLTSLLLVVGKTIDLKKLEDTETRPIFLLLALLMVIGSWLQEAWRLQIIGRLFQQKIPFFQMLRIVLATIFAAGVTPFASGQGPVQVYLLHQEGLSYGCATAILSVRLFLTTLSFSLLTPLVALVYRARLALGERVYTFLDLAVVLSLLLSFLALAVLARPQWLRTWLLGWISRRRHRKTYPSSLRKTILSVLREVRELETAFALLRRTPPRSLVLPFFLTISYWLFYFLTTPLLLLAFGYQASWLQVVGLQLVFTYLLSYVPLPGASGAAELGFASLFARFIPTGLVGLFVSLWRLLTYHLGLLVGGVALFHLVKGAEKEG